MSQNDRRVFVSEDLEPRVFLSASKLIPVGAPQVAVGDVNGDGRADIITCQNNIHLSRTRRGAVSTREASLSVTDGTSNTILIGLLLPAVQTVRVAAGDFDGDGSVDVAIVEGAQSAHPGGVNVLFGDGSVRLGKPVLVGQLSSRAGGEVVVGDFDGDGSDDIGVYRNGIIAILIGLLRPAENGGTLAREQDVKVDFGRRQVRNIAVGDFDGDGSVDLAACMGDGSVRIAEMGDGSVFKDTGPAAGFLGGVYVGVADVNGDGVADVIALSKGVAQVGLGSKNGLLPAVQSELWILPYIEQNVLMGDANGDGRADLIVVSRTGKAGVLGYGNRDGTFSTAPVK